MVIRIQMRAMVEHVVHRLQSEALLHLGEGRDQDMRADDEQQRESRHSCAEVV